MKEDIAIAGLKKDVEYLKIGFNEFKIDIKDIRDKLDEIIIEWQKFGGLYSSVQQHNERLTELEKWQKKINPAFDEICNSFKDNKLRTKDLFWEVLKIAVTGAISIAGMAIWLTYFN